MKILYYNWVPFDDDEHRGGGVSIYQKNTIEELAKKDNVDLYFICSGLHYTFSPKKVYIEPYKNCYGNACKSFRIVNSPILSPAYSAWGDIDIYLNDSTLLDLFVDFINKNGPFDIIHFNNFEGLSLKVLDIKKIFPKTKIIYSLHNYYSFCPQVNLWKCEHENCVNNHNGKDCIFCVNRGATKDEIVFADALSYKLKKLHLFSNSIIFKLCFRYLYYIKKLLSKLIDLQTFKNDGWNCVSSEALINLYSKYREYNVAYINQNVDLVLAVSDRVRQIALNYGISANKLKTSYIGTKFTLQNKNASKSFEKKDIFNIIYMGYARRDKGFFFLMECLKHMPKRISSRINLYLAVDINDPKTLFELKRIGSKFHSLYLKKGYKHAELSDMLSEMDLGIIPVLWEDNLPQVAIEITAHHVPILCSDLGGAHELSSSKAFVFKNNNVNDFISQISRIIEEPDILEDYWKNFKGLISMNEHIEELLEFYNC